MVVCVRLCVCVCLCARLSVCMSLCLCMHASVQNIFPFIKKHQLSQYPLQLSPQQKSLDSFLSHLHIVKLGLSISSDELHECMLTWIVVLQLTSLVTLMINMAVRSHVTVKSASLSVGKVNLLFQKPQTAVPHSEIAMLVGCVALCYFPSFCHVLSALYQKCFEKMSKAGHICSCLHACCSPLNLKPTLILLLILNT